MAVKKIIIQPVQISTVRGTIRMKPFIQQFLQIQEEFEIGDDNLYNMDETSLFWRMLPKEVLTRANEKRVGGKDKK